MGSGKEPGTYSIGGMLRVLIPLGHLFTCFFGQLGLMQNNFIFPRNYRGMDWCFVRATLRKH